MKNVVGYLEEQQKSAKDPDIATIWAKLEDLYNRKLWHQLTLEVLDFVKNAKAFQDDELFKFYENFVADFEHRINSLSLMEVVFCVVQTISDHEKAIQFLDKIREKVKKHPTADVLCLTSKASILIKQKDMKDAKEVLSEAREILDAQDGISPVHGRFYDMCSEYHRLQGDHAAYYHDALRYLGCTELDALTAEEKEARALVLSISALLGKGVYNFGELLSHPILDTLKSKADHEWLVDVLDTFNSGDIPRWESLRPKWSIVPDLVASEAFLLEKLRLLCVMELTFTRPAKSRQLTFSEIAQRTKLSVNEVELLVMKALSLELVRGSIDEVDQKVHLTWVQPRVLNKNQIGTMKQRLDLWCEDVKSMGNLLENQAHEILDKVY